MSPESLASEDLQCSRDLEEDREQPHALDTRGCEALFMDLEETLVAKSQDVAGLWLLQRTWWEERTYTCNPIFLALTRCPLLSFRPQYFFSV